jgi:hypothetical protein
MPESLTDEESPRDDIFIQRHTQDVEIREPSMRRTVTRVGDIDPATVQREPTHGSGNCAQRFIRATSFHRDP